MKKIIAIAVSLVMLLSLSVLSFAVESPAAVIDTTKASIPQELKDKKATLKGLHDQGTQLREALKSTKGDIKGKLQSEKDRIKALKEEDPENFKDLKEAFVALKGNVKTYKDQAKTIIDEMKSQHQTMLSYRAELKAAMQAKDYDKASGILDNMTQLKTAKNANLQKLLDIKNAVSNIVNSGVPV